MRKIERERTRLELSSPIFGKTVEKQTNEENLRM